jgi:hypothetical protein
MIIFDHWIFLLSYLIALHLNSTNGSHLNSNCDTGYQGAYCDGKDNFILFVFFLKINLKRAVSCIKENFGDM